MALLEIFKRVGIGGNSSQGGARGDNTGAVVTTQAHGTYTEPASLAKIFEACTAVGGVAPGTALSTTPPMALWNPPTSNVNLAVFKTSMGYVSGTLGAGCIVYATGTAQTTVPSTGSELIPQCTLIGAPRGVGRVFQGSTISLAGTVLRASYTLGAFVGGANPPALCADFIDGAIIVQPGGLFIMQGVAGAGTSPLVIFGVCWEEVPII